LAAMTEDCAVLIWDLATIQRGLEAIGLRSGFGIAGSGAGVGTERIRWRMRQPAEEDEARWELDRQAWERIQARTAELRRVSEPSMRGKLLESRARFFLELGLGAAARKDAQEALELRPLDPSLIRLDQDIGESLARELLGSGGVTNRLDLQGER